MGDKQAPLHPKISRAGPLPRSVQPQFIHASKARTRASFICKQTWILAFNNITAAYMCGSRNVLYSRNITVIFTVHFTEKIQDLCAKIRRNWSTDMEQTPAEKSGFAQPGRRHYACFPCVFNPLFAIAHISHPVMVTISYQGTPGVATASWACFHQEHLGLCTRGQPITPGCEVTASTGRTMLGHCVIGVYLPS